MSFHFAWKKCLCPLSFELKNSEQGAKFMRRGGRWPDEGVMVQTSEVA